MIVSDYIAVVSHINDLRIFILLLLLIVKKYAMSHSTEISNNFKEFENELAGIQTQINNTVNAIANGMFHPSMKHKTDELEARKSALVISIEEANRQAEINCPSRDQIYYYLSQDADIKNKSLEDQKRIIQTYVCRVVVFDNHIETDTIVSFDGGGEPYQSKITTDISGYRHTSKGT